MASCPFKGMWGGKAEEAATDPAAAQAPPPRKCPFARNTQPRDEGAAASGPAQCPLGFGSAQGPKLSSLHCVVCKSLYHDCVVTNCGHSFCAGCVSNFRDCPVCGADVVSTTPDPATQGLVEKFIDTHAGDMSLWEAEGLEAPAASASGPGAPGQRGRAAFLLQLGLRAMSGSNLGAAAHRLQQCKAELEAQAAAGGSCGSAPPEAAAALRCQLGAVTGCLGDCQRGLGDGEAALAHYEESAGHLRQAGPSVEARQALSVTLAKVGELHHLRGDLGAALPSYAQSLDLRRALLQDARRDAAAAAAAAGPAPPGGGGHGEGPLDPGAVSAAALDVAVGCVKLARAREEAGGVAAAGAAELAAEAQGLLREVTPHAVALPPAQRRKLDSLTAFLAGPETPR